MVHGVEFALLAAIDPMLCLLRLGKQSANLQQRRAIFKRDPVK